MTAAAVARMPRQQVAPKSTGLERETLEPEGALSVEACAMYGQQLATLRQLDALALKMMAAEHSHERADLTPLLNHMRTLNGMLLERVYRLACDAPASLFTQAREARAALQREAEAVLWPKSST